jgi:two-component system NtrC family sensor kinase
LKSVVNMLQKNFGYYHVHCYLFDTESDSLIMQQGSGSIGRELKERGHHLEPGEGIVGYVATLGETYMTNSVDDTVFYRANPLLPETEAELAAPLRVREETLGVLDVQHQAPDSFDEDDLRFINAIADQLAVVLDKAMIYTELQNALAKEQAARTQLVQTETLTAMGRLVASVAHELNNPLQAIRSALYLIQTEDELSGQSARDLQVAIDETKRMAGLIGRLRETSRPVEDTEFEREHLNTLVHEVEKLIATHLRHHEIALVFNTEANLPPVPVIRDRIKQVILNLCINAIESMPSGGTITIATAYLEEEGMVKLSVSDTGPGIEPDVLPRLFEPFFTTKEQGTGLGLYISYDIAQHHQGQLDVYSEVGSGTTFELLLPLERS